MFNTLIAEDNAVFRRTLSQVLSRRFPFMHILEAPDGERAIELTRDIHPDLVFMDIRMPGMNGLDATKAIKAIHADAVVCIVTSHDLPEYREAAVHCGASHFIVKDESSETVIVEMIEALIYARLKTLIIEDSPSFRSAVRSALSARWPAMILVEADDGPIGLREAAGLKPDVVLLDLHLPTVNGIDLLKPIKSEHPRTTIVIVTAYDLPVYREAASRFGADHFLSKEDAVTEKLSAILNSIIEQRLATSIH